jgi:hypothetical protein
MSTNQVRALIVMFFRGSLAEFVVIQGCRVGSLYFKRSDFAV